MRITLAGKSLATHEGFMVIASTLLLVMLIVTFVIFGVDRGSVIAFWLCGSVVVLQILCLVHHTISKRGSPDYANHINS